MTNTKVNVERSGTVVSKSGDKTYSVLVEKLLLHRRYGKVYKNSKKFLVHSEDNGLNIGDKVLIVECRPLSKRKNWRVLKVLEQAKLKPLKGLVDL